MTTVSNWHLECIVPLGFGSLLHLNASCLFEAVLVCAWYDALWRLWSDTRALANNTTLSASHGAARQSAWQVHFNVHTNGSLDPLTGYIRLTVLPLTLTAIRFHVIKPTSIKQSNRNQKRTLLMFPVLPDFTGHCSLFRAGLVTPLWTLSIDVFKRPDWFHCPEGNVNSIAAWRSAAVYRQLNGFQWISMRFTRDFSKIQ